MSADAFLAVLRLADEATTVADESPVPSPALTDLRDQRLRLSAAVKVLPRDPAIDRGARWP